MKKFFKKLRVALVVIPDLFTIKLLWPYVKTTAEAEWEQLRARLKTLAAEDEQVGAFWRAAERVWERLKRL